MNLRLVSTILAGYSTTTYAFTATIHAARTATIRPAVPLQRLHSTAVPPAQDDETKGTITTSANNEQSSFVSSSHVYEKDIPFLIEHLAADNFDVSLELLEPLLMSECAGQECEDYLEQLQTKAASIGKALPEDFVNVLLQ